MSQSSLNSTANEALLAFWRDAGVDACYLDEPIDRTVFVPPSPPAPVLRAISSHPSPNGAIAPVEAMAEAHRLAAAAQTLDELAIAIAGFKGCQLTAMGAKQSVFGRGNPNGSLLVIGDAPGDTEDQTGKAFSGAPGQMLDRILEAAGLTDQAYLSNAVYWKTPGNRPPSPEELAVCAPFVERTLSLMRPRAVLLIGSTAAKAALNTDESLMKIRGQWQEWRLSDASITTPAMVTFHPAFLLRQPQAKGVVWADFLRLSQKLLSAQVEAST